MKVINAGLILLAFSLVSCVSWVFAKSPFSDMPEGNYELDLTHASVVWKVSHFGLSQYVGRFASFDAVIQFDPVNIENSKVSASIDPMSIQTAYPKTEEEDFDNVLATKEGWFNASVYPSIEFESTRIEMNSDNTGLITGELNFLGKTIPVTLDVTLNGAMRFQPLTRKPTMGFSASTVIERSQWGMTKYLPNIGDQVKVMIEAEFTKTQ